jgi:hypothetical protein
MSVMRSAERHARRMLGRSYLTPPTLAEALDRANRMAQAGPNYHRTVEHVGRFRWVWRITDDSVSPHVVAATGRAWTKRRGWARLERAYARLLNAAYGRAES